MRVTYYPFLNRFVHVVPSRVTRGQFPLLQAHVMMSEWFKTATEASKTRLCSRSLRTSVVVKLLERE